MVHDGIPDGDAATLALLEAYLAAVYRVGLDDAGLTLRIGEAAPAPLAQALPADRWTLLTAWNPQSVPQDAAANAAADAVLQAQLDALGLPRRPARSGSADGQWEERGWLVAGLDTVLADGLARRHEQAGILHWRRGEPVRLRMYRPQPAHASFPHVDWHWP